MKRTTIVIVLLAAILAPIWAQVWGEGITSDGFEWDRTRDGRGIIIVLYTGTATTVRIPDRINNLPVVEIGEKAFSPLSGVSTIGSRITSVAIPNTVTIIGRDAFSACALLTSVNLPTSLTTIEQSAFRDSYVLSAIALPSTITTIGDRAFSGCRGLTTVTVPASVRRITFGTTARVSTTVFWSTNLNEASRTALRNIGYSGDF